MRWRSHYDQWLGPLTIMRSPEHAKEKARSRPIKPEDEEAVNQKKREVELKMQVHSLKHQLRQMKRENAHELYPQKYEALEQQLQDLTLQHGYGKLPLDGSL